ncbi:MAG: hypothetical protein FWG57_05455 [Endomicrobia bacterium]|nr:hypothetical protein [Endomicrobiia bacterium]
MNKIKLFEDKKIRTAWDENEEEWYFSINLKKRLSTLHFAAMFPILIFLF